MSHLLVICPHAMDEALGCGGTLARAAAGGAEVRVLVPFGDGTGMDAGRRLAAPQAAARLGIPAPVFLGLPESRGDALPLLDVVQLIEKAAAGFAADTVYVPHGGSLHVDHRVSAAAALTAFRPVPGQTV